VGLGLFRTHLLGCNGVYRFAVAGVLGKGRTSHVRTTLPEGTVSGFAGPGISLIEKSS
jgi:hypothetical protein